MTKYAIYWETDSEMDWNEIEAESEEKALEEFRSQVLDTLLDNFNLFWSINREFMVCEGNEENAEMKLREQGIKVKRVLRSVLIANVKEEHNDYKYLALVEID